MRKLLVCWTFALAASAVLPLSAEDMAPPLLAERAGRQSIHLATPASGVISQSPRSASTRDPDAAAGLLPGTDHAARLPVRPASAEHSGRALVEAVAAWLGSEFALPAMDDPPTLVVASPRTMISLRSAGMFLDRAGSDRAEVVAVYHDQSRTIYLPAGWTGSTPAELSVLVHEMVHHLQDSAGAKFECPEAREKMAYEAQARWLAMSGSGLAAAFGIDPMTLLVRTNCFR